MSIAESTTTSTWTIDPAHTGVEFSLKHLMISTVRGRFGAVSGTIVLDEANPEASSVTAEIDVTSIDTRQEQRDAHLRSADFFDVEKFPSIKFVSTRIEALGGGSYNVIGDLTIRDVTREVVLEATDEGRGGDPWGGQRAGFSATTRIDRRDFGLTWNQALETGGVVVGNEIKITLEVEAVKAA
ncbi:MAG TPA: YceI family protein [Longimicrobium sp.]